MRKLALIITFMFLSTILLRYTITSACPDNPKKQDYLNKYEEYKKTWNSHRDKKDDSLDNKKTDSSNNKNRDSSADCRKEEAFQYYFNKWYPQSSQDNCKFSMPSADNTKWNTFGSFDNESSSSKAMEQIKEALGKTKEMLNDVENKAKAQINLEIKKSKSLIDEIINDEDMDLKTKKEKIYEIKRNLNKKIKKIEDSVVEQVKAIVEQQYEKTDLLLGSVNP